jgi:hypothetical protein
VPTQASAGRRPGPSWTACPWRRSASRSLMTMMTLSCWRRALRAWLRRRPPSPLACPLSALCSLLVLSSGNRSRWRMEPHWLGPSLALELWAAGAPAHIAQRRFHHPAVRQPSCDANGRCPRSPRPASHWGTLALRSQAQVPGNQGASQARPQGWRPAPASGFPDREAHHQRGPACAG